ncbi:MAG: DUF302 domain-containing protein [Myxococcales bacterium]|nr:DUF302 domain-containing protein [Myxococcales bacterium]MDH3485449.1 DUF302 domain-containing protein [Myxococcales bacterium]
MNEFDYGFEATLTGSFDEVLDRVAGALKKEGFGVLTKIDVAETLKKKLGVKFRQYAILGACNPLLAKQALEHDRNIGLLLPCNVVVQSENPGEVSVSIVAPRAMFSVVDDPALEPVVTEVDARLRRVIGALQN